MAAGRGGRGRKNELHGFFQDDFEFWFGVRHPVLISLAPKETQKIGISFRRFRLSWDVSQG